MQFRSKSNQRPVLLLMMWANLAFGQSSALLEAVRVHRDSALSSARDELQTCIARGPPCPSADRLSLLTGFLQLADGDAAGAVTQLGRRPAPSGLEAFHLWYLAEAQSWSGQREAALKSLKKARAAAPPWLQKRIDLRTGELLLAQGKALKALALLEPAADEDPSPELLYQRGLARLLASDQDKGRADLKAVVVRFASHPHAELALRRLEGPGKPVTFTFEERLQRAGQFQAAGALEQASAELEQATPTGSRGPGRLALARAGLLFARGDEPAALAQIELAMAGPPSVVAEALLLRARRLMRAGENRVARELLTTVDQKYPKEAGADDASYLAAWLAMQSGDFNDSAAAFETFENRHPDSKKRDEARWFRSYALYRGARFAEARATLESLLTDFPRSQLVPQAKYWAARCAQQLPSADAGAGPGVTDDYRALITVFPGSFYALLAAERLRELGLTPAPPFPDAPREVTVDAPAQLKLAQALARTGLFHDASDETLRAIGTVGSAEQALKFGQALQQLGEFGAAHALAAKWLWGAVYSAKQPEALALMYPRAFRSSVEAGAAKAGLDPYLAWAIMRRESAFRPEVFSAADARGLMQIIPPTARAIARERNQPAPPADELFSPEENISLGTWYLSALIDRFAHPSLCAAAYNAGPSAVVRWTQARGTLPLDEWVEEISFKETRGYVKQVTADYFIYRGLYQRSGEPLRLSLTVPAPRLTGVTF